MRSKLMYCSLIALFSFFKAFSQDSIYFHNGNTASVSISKIGEETISFKYPNEDADNEFSKYAIEKVKFGKSGREEHLSDKIIINGEDDWEKVTILESPAATTGLKKIGSVAGKTSFINYRSATGGDKKALEKIKKAAAKQNAPFILLSSDKNFGIGLGWGSNQSSKKGTCYNY